VFLWPWQPPTFLFSTAGDVDEAETSSNPAELSNQEEEEAQLTPLKVKIVFINQIIMSVKCFCNVLQGLGASHQCSG